MVTMASVLDVRAPSVVVDNHHIAGRGWTLAPMGPHRQPGGASVHVGGCLGLRLVVTLIIACWWVQAFSSFRCGYDISGGG
jgi:hypothetical protein